jgi:hypothetical protein
VEEGRTKKKKKKKKKKKLLTLIYNLENCKPLKVI